MIGRKTTSRRIETRCGNNIRKNNAKSSIPLYYSFCNTLILELFRRECTRIPDSRFQQCETRALE